MTQQHGRLINTNSGVEIPGTFKGGIKDDFRDMIAFTIDGAGSSQNNFPRSQGWTFVPDLPAKNGIWLYYSYGLDEDGDLSQFPNLIVKAFDGEWYRIGNHSADKSHLSEAEVTRLFTSAKPPVPLTLKDPLNGEG